MKRMLLVAAAAALLVGVACAPVKPPPGPLYDTYVTSVQVHTVSNVAGHTFTVQVTCDLSYIHNGEPPLPPRYGQVTDNGTLFENWGQQDVVSCTAVETGTDGATVRYGVPGLDGPPDTSILSSQPQECYYQEGGKGNTQACNFYIENTFGP